MSVHSEKSTWLIFLVLCSLSLGVASEETQMEQTTINIPKIEPMDPIEPVEPKLNTTKDLVASETADPKKVDIVKQIRRLNEDGSYTVGYEAGDGTFKIESRDVQGNIKGTFGYVDPNGEIKRVSYSTSNTSQSSLLSSVGPPTRLNRTSTGTTRRPQPTLVYPKSSSNPTRQTVIQAIPRRRPVNIVSSNPSITTTESYRVVAGNILGINNSDSIASDPQTITLKTFPLFTQRTLAESTDSNNEPILKDLKLLKEIGKIPVELNNTSSTASPTYIRPSLIYEKVPERTKDVKPLRANTFRRQLSSNNYDNAQMYAFQQSAGDDTTDVYGGSISLGTPRPLFTTTSRPRLIPIQTILASRQKLNEKLATNSPQVHEEQQETTLEATTNKVQDENYVTTNPVPIYQFPQPQHNFEQRLIERPYLRPHPSQVPVAQFRTREFLRDNPGAAIPIGNQRVLFRYNPNTQTDPNGQLTRHHIQPEIPPNTLHVANRPHIHNAENTPVNPDINHENKPNLVAVPIYPENPQAARYQLYNPYNDGRGENTIPRRIPIERGPFPTQHQLNEIRPISTPVSTRDLKLLLHHLLMRQNRLQALMDIRDDLNSPGPPYQNPQFHQQGQLFNPEYQHKPNNNYEPRQQQYPQQFSEARPYNTFVPQNPYNPYQPPYPNHQNQFPNRNEYRSQDDNYRNEITNFDPAAPYESQRFVPRRRFTRPRMYDPRYEDVPNGNQNEDQIEYLPPDVREALLLKMLMLAIHPDFSSMPDPPNAITTPVPEYRKKVRNVQILGEETQTKDDDTKREKRMM